MTRLFVALYLLAGLADGFDRCRWQVVRPTTCDVRLDARLALSAGPSAAAPGDADR